MQGYGALAEVEGCDLQKSGTYMFGFSLPLISKHIQACSEVSHSSACHVYEIFMIFPFSPAVC